jgi:hypothetical protein
MGRGEDGRELAIARTRWRAQNQLSAHLLPCHPFRQRLINEALQFRFLLSGGAGPGAQFCRLVLSRSLPRVFARGKTGGTGGRAREGCWARRPIRSSLFPLGLGTIVRPHPHRSDTFAPTFGSAKTSLQNRGNRTFVWTCRTRHSEVRSRAHAPAIPSEARR